MSKYSGKCDFYDHLFMSAESEEDAFNKFNGTELYIYQPSSDNKANKSIASIMKNNYKKIKYSSIEDLIAYYPYIIGIGSFNKDNNKSTICLSSESFVDREERESLEWRLKEVLKIYVECRKRNKNFTTDLVKKIMVFSYNAEVLEELVKRVKKYGKMATTEDLHLPVYDRYRKELVKEMLKHNMNPSDYGYSRFVEKKEG